MVVPQKRILFFLVAALVLGASPAFSVPLSSGIENPGAVAYGTSGTTDPDGETTLQTVAIITEEAGPNPEMGMAGASGASAMGSGGGMPGWVLPAAGVGVGGGALLAVLSHDHGSGSDASALGASSGRGAGGGISGMGTTNDGTPGGSSDVPEPGTLMLMGAGLASFLGRRRLFSK